MYGEEQEREIWEEGQWDRRPGSPRSVVARGGLGFHLALVFDDCFVSAALFCGFHKRLKKLLRSGACAWVAQALPQ